MLGEEMVIVCVIKTHQNTQSVRIPRPHPFSNVKQKGKKMRKTPWTMCKNSNQLAFLWFGVFLSLLFIFILFDFALFSVGFPTKKVLSGNTSSFSEFLKWFWVFDFARLNIKWHTERNQKTAMDKTNCKFFGLKSKHCKRETRINENARMRTTKRESTKQKC